MRSDTLRIRAPLCPNFLTDYYMPFRVCFGREGHLPRPDLFIPVCSIVYLRLFLLVLWRLWPFLCPLCTLGYF